MSFLQNQRSASVASQAPRYSQTQQRVRGMLLHLWSFNERTPRPAFLVELEFKGWRWMALPQCCFAPWISYNHPDTPSCGRHVCLSTGCNGHYWIGWSLGCRQLSRLRGVRRAGGCTAFTCCPHLLFCFMNGLLLDEGCLTCKLACQFDSFSGCSDAGTNCMCFSSNRQISQTEVSRLPYVNAKPTLSLPPVGFLLCPPPCSLSFSFSLSPFFVWLTVLV